MLFWIAPAFKLAPYVLGALDYLRSNLFPPAPVTRPATSYIPPFRGGQSIGVAYQLFLSYDVWNNGVFAYTVARNGAFPLTAPVRGITITRDDGYAVVASVQHGGAPYDINLVSGRGGVSVQNFNPQVERVDGQLDTGGDLPDPSGSLPISGDGIATNDPLNLDSAPTVIEAIPPVVLPSFAAALAAALAAARNALDALDAIKAVARAIEALSDLLNKKNDEENKKEKEKKESQDTIRYQFGSIERDGFLRLYPQSNLVKYVAQQLDISFVVIPTYLGKYFGKFSPNYYRYKPTSNLISSLGYISFVSPTFGILSTHHLEFRRTSIKVPENSIGFYYHLGLDGALIANAFAFYTKPKP